MRFCSLRQQKTQRLETPVLTWGCHPGRLFESKLGATLREIHRYTMNIPRQFLRAWVVLCLLAAFAEPIAVAQANPAPPLTQGPPMRPSGQRPAGLPSRMVSTGLSENGGSISNGVYSNSIFGFSLNLPPGWPLAPIGDPVPLKREAGEPSAPSGKQTIRPILIVTENAPLKKSYERKSVQVLAMHLAVQPGPKSAEGFLAYSEKTAKEKGMPVEYLGSPEAVTINGRQLWKATLNETTAGGVQHIEQYVVTEGSTLLQFMLVSPDAAGLKSLEPTIQSLRFKEAAKKRKKSAPKKTK